MDGLQATTAAEAHENEQFVDDLTLRSLHLVPGGMLCTLKRAVVGRQKRYCNVFCMYVWWFRHLMCGMK